MAAVLRGGRGDVGPTDFAFDKILRGCTHAGIFLGCGDLGTLLVLRQQFEAIPHCQNRQGGDQQLSETETEHDYVPCCVGAKAPPVVLQPEARPHGARFRRR